LLRFVVTVGVQVLEIGCFHIISSDPVTVVAEGGIRHGFHGIWSAGIVNRPEFIPFCSQISQLCGRFDGLSNIEERVADVLRKFRDVADLDSGVDFARDLIIQISCVVEVPEETRKIRFVRAADLGRELAVRMGDGKGVG
jgi:hypothetical protein